MPSKNITSTDGPRCQRLMRMLEKKTNEKTVFDNWWGYTREEYFTDHNPDIDIPEPLSVDDPVDDLCPIYSSRYKYRCLCGKEIGNMAYISHVCKNIHLAIGVCCVKRFMAGEKSNKRCVGCKKPYKGSDYKYCRDCRTNRCVLCGMCKDIYDSNICGECKTNRCILCEMPNNVCDSRICGECSILECQCGAIGISKMHKLCEPRRLASCEILLNDRRIDICKTCANNKCKCGEICIDHRISFTKKGGERISDLIKFNKYFWKKVVELPCDASYGNAVRQAHDIVVYQQQITRVLLLCIY